MCGTKESIGCINILLKIFQVSQQNSTQSLQNNQWTESAIIQNKLVSVTHLVASRGRCGILLQVCGLEQRALGKRLQQPVMVLLDSLHTQNQYHLSNGGQSLKSPPLQSLPLLHQPHAHTHARNARTRLQTCTQTLLTPLNVLSSSPLLLLWHIPLQSAGHNSHFQNSPNFTRQFSAGP